MIIHSLEEDLKNFLKQIEDLGFSLCLVGGIPRDFLFTKKIGDDFDFEIRPDAHHKVTIDSWPQYYKKLLQFFSSQKLKFTELPYLITRVDYKNYKLEFSSPRVEENIAGNLSHHHFVATLDPNLTYEQSFKRRDLTINAIGVELHFGLDSDQLIDPYEGKKAIETGVLKQVSEDFFADHVRFLRLARFQAKFNRFSLDVDLYDKLARFDLSSVSLHHFKSELEKSFVASFLNTLSKWCKEKSIAFSPQLSFLLSWHYPDTIVNKEGLLVFLFEQNEKEAIAFAKAFSLPEKKLKDLKSFFESYQYLSSLKQEEIAHIKELPLAESLAHRYLREVKNLSDKREWMTYVPNASVFVVDISKIVVDQKELDALAPALRSFYVYHKAIHGHQNN